MKAIPISLSPTRSRALNMFLGLVLALASILLFLSLVTYHPADPSIDTAADAGLSPGVQNWIGLFGAGLSDLALQFLGLTAFIVPLWIGSIGWGWMRSRSRGTVWLRCLGSVLAVLFTPAVFGLLPWHWRWMHALPVEGVMGRLIASSLVAYLNIQGAWLVAAALAGAGIYFAFAVSFWAMKQMADDRWAQLMAWNDRWRNWREARADEKVEREAARAEQQSPGPNQRLFSGSIPVPADESQERPAKRPFSLASLFRRKDKTEAPDPIDEIPTFQRTAAQPANAPGSEKPARRPSIWERSATQAAPAAVGPVPVPAPPAPTVAPVPMAIKPARPIAEPQPLSTTPEPAGVIAIHERADADVRTVTVAPKNVSGFKLPRKHAPQRRRRPASSARR